MFEIKVRGRAELDDLLRDLRCLVDPATDQIRLYNFGSRPASPTILGNREIEEWRDFIIV